MLPIFFSVVSTIAMRIAEARGSKPQSYQEPTDTAIYGRKQGYRKERGLAA